MASRAASIFSVVVSILALGISVAAYFSAGHQAAAAVRNREQTLIRHFKPQFDRAYADFHTQLSPTAKNPQTVEDLVDPLFQLMASTTQPTSGSR
jgi:hypothetical protein